MRNLADKSTPGPWVNLKGRFWDAMRAFKKKTRKWWHGNQRSCYPLSLICIDDHYGKPISDNDLAEGFPDWWDLKKVVDVRLSDTKRDYAAAGHINDEDADFIAECRAGVPALCDEVERLEAENARLKLIAENAPLLDSMGRGVGNPLDRLENENATLRVENADLRAKLAERYDPVSALDAACRASGIPLADDYEQRLAEWRAYFDAPVTPDSDSAIFRAMADDPEAYPSDAT